MKRLISVLLSSALLCALLLPAAAAADAPSAWANDEVYRALELGFVPEKLQGDYQKEITRAEFAEIAIYFLAVQYGYPANAKGGDGTGSNYQVENFLTDYCDKKNDRTGRPFDLKSYDPDGVNTTFHWWTAFTSQEKFSDVDMSDTETRGFVNAAYALGIVNGTNESATSFHPNGAITRQEAAAMLQRTYTCYASNLPAAGALTFSDKNSVADWAASSVSLLAQWGVMQGKEQNTFDPLGTYTREQCIVTFMRLYDRAPEGRAKGTVGTLYSYEEQIQRLTRLGTYGSSILYRADAPTCTVLYVGYLGGVQTYTAFRILYKDGTYRTVDLVKGYASGFYLNAAQTAVNFVNVTGGSMSLDLATGEISQGFK